MRPLKPFREWGIVLLSFLAFSACHGGGGGAAPAPIPTTVLTVGAPVSDTIVRSTFNAYSATVTPGSFYKISITGMTDDVDLNVYDTDNTFRNPIICPIDNGAIIGTSPEDCILIPSGNTLYFGVNGSVLAGSAAVYTIDVELLPETNLNLSIPQGDQTTQRTAAAYSLPVTPGAYTVSMTGLTDDADIHVFTENGSVVSPAVCSPPDNTLFIGKEPEDCTVNVNTSNTTVLFIVDGIFSSAPTVQYTALVTPAPNVAIPANEGSVAAPINILVDTPTTGSVGPAGTSRYQAAGLLPNLRYTLSITGLTGVANLTPFADSTFTTHIVCSIDNTLLAGTTPKSCTFQAPQAGTVFFDVSSIPGTVNGASYIILVEQGP
ncbi:MAG TPA: hypothetical protein VFK23_00070 [Nitrospirota bacterium]|nr:hypothetical protein [Nitrospirota bacterium]